MIDKHFKLAVDKYALSSGKLIIGRGCGKPRTRKLFVFLILLRRKGLNWTEIENLLEEGSYYEGYSGV